MPLGYEIALQETFLGSKVAETCNFPWPGASYAHHVDLNKVVGGVLALFMGWRVSGDQRISPRIFAREVEIRGDSPIVINPSAVLPKVSGSNNLPERRVIHDEVHEVSDDGCCLGRPDDWKQAMAQRTTAAAKAFSSNTYLGHQVSFSDKDKHACKGQNSCKGKGGCKSGDNGCKGQNSCKGKGGCATDGSKPPSA